MFIFDNNKIYEIVEQYPHISIGVDALGNKVAFQNSYLKLSARKRVEQNAYWEGVEAEFGSSPLEIRYGF